MPQAVHGQSAGERRASIDRAAPFEVDEPNQPTSRVESPTCDLQECRRVQPPYAPPNVCEPGGCILPEQRQLELREPIEFAALPLAALGLPADVNELSGVTSSLRKEQYLTLDAAICFALANADVIRIVAGNAAISTDQTIFDPAITNTQVDQARSSFDPSLNLRNDYLRTENPEALFDPTRPTGANIDAIDVDRYALGMDVTQRKTGGGEAQWGVTTSPTRTALPGLPLNPRTPSAVEMRYSQPLLRGRGRDVNLAPVVIARIDTERSFYQLKDSVQQMVQSVIASYWGIVFARTDLWARQQQIEQFEFALERLEAGMVVGRSDLGDTAQARVSLATFKANLIAAQADLLDREAAFFSVIGWDPDCWQRIIPVTPPISESSQFEWESLLETAEQNRPDIIQRKLFLEIDRQRLLVATNNTLPQLDAVTLYRMNMLGGRAPSGDIITGEPFQFHDLQVGLNLALPLGQRASRATLRQQQLTVARDQALLDQQLLSAKHSIAQSLRNLASFYAQYRSFQEVRKAARVNLDRQLQFFRIGGIPTERVTAVEVLLAVTDWGNAVSSEAFSLTQYNAELASLQLQIGTILEAHGVQFYEDRFLSMAPFTRGVRDYPKSTPASENLPRYEGGDEPSEESFNLESLLPELLDPFNSNESNPEKLKEELDRLQEESLKRLYDAPTQPPRINGSPSSGPPSRPPSLPAPTPPKPAVESSTAEPVPTSPIPTPIPTPLRFEPSTLEGMIRP